MMPLKSLLPLTLVLTSLYASLSLAQGQTLFRYLNEEGRKVISDVIPPEYAIKGYEVIGSKGQVVRVVPPEPSDEEKARIQQAKAEKRRLEKWDKELLSRYSSTRDIEATQSRRVKGIENSIFSLRLTLKNISETIKFYQAEAATHERQGAEVSTDTLASIERLQKDRDFIVDENMKKERYKKKISDQYNNDIERFKQIKPGA